MRMCLNTKANVQSGSEAEKRAGNLQQRLMGFFLLCGSDQKKEYVFCQYAQGLISK